MTENEVANRVIGMRLEVRTWRVEKDEKTGLPKLAGRYVVMSGDKEIASQSFNDSYGSRELPFSLDVLNQAKQIENLILSEIQGLVR